MVGGIGDDKATPAKERLGKDGCRKPYPGIPDCTDCGLFYTSTLGPNRYYYYNNNGKLGLGLVLGLGLG